MKRLKLNRELRTRSMVVRFHLLWVAFYALLFIGIVGFGAYLYHEHAENQLPSGHVELTVSKTAYQPGEVVEFSIKNNFPTTIYTTNRCPEEPLDVYRWQDDGWQQIHDKAVKGEAECFTQPRKVPLQAGGTIIYNFKDWPRLFAEAGVYRIVLHIDHYDDLPFQDFKVLEAPTVQPPTSTNAAEDTPAAQSDDTQQPTQEERGELRDNADEPPEPGDD